MLVLTRKSGESILVSDNIKIVIMDSRYGKVRIGVDAPMHVSIRRSELNARQYDRESDKDDLNGDRPS